MTVYTVLFTPSRTAPNIQHLDFAEVNPMLLTELQENSSFLLVLFNIFLFGLCPVSDAAIRESMSLVSLSPVLFRPILWHDAISQLPKWSQDQFAKPVQSAAFLIIFVCHSYSMSAVARSKVRLRLAGPSLLRITVMSGKVEMPLL
jgi:hypothetical protein